MNELSQARLYLSALATVLTAADAAMSSIGTQAHEQAEIRKFVSAIGGAKNMSLDKTQYYAAHGYSHETAVSILRKNDIPTVSVHITYDEEQSSTTLIAVPKQYKEAADDIIAKLNRTHIKNEETRKKFFHDHLGKEIATIEGIDRGMKNIIRDAMIAQCASYAFEDAGDGKWKLHCEKTDADMFRDLVFRARVESQSGQGKVREFIITKQEAAINDAEILAAELKENKKDKHDVYICDAENTEKIFRIRDDTLEEISNGTVRELANRNTDSKEVFTAKLIVAVREMKAPAVQARQRSLEEPRGAEDVFSAQSLALSRADLAQIAAQNGHIGMAQEYASQIAYMRCYGSGRNQKAIDALNRTVNMAQFLTTDDAGVAIDSIKEKLYDLHVLEKEEQTVLNFVKKQIEAYDKIKITEQKITADQLDFDDIDAYIGYQMDMERNSPDKEPGREH